MLSTLSLPDGRTLAYAEYGDPHGKPVFLFHGMPGSRLFRPPDEVTARLGVRLITVDRPGYGASTFQPKRRILDWPADIDRLADALGLDRFVVAGHSGGGPYTLACAYALPERVKVAAPICGAGPVEAPNATRGMLFPDNLGFRYGRYLPWPVWQALVWLIYRRKLTPAVSAAPNRKRSRRPAADQDQMDLLAVREACILSETEAFRPGLRGFAWDARLLTRSWGFPLNGIRVPVRLWHGTDDITTPLPMAEYVASQLPNCRTTICPGEAHLLIFPHWHEILSSLVME